MVDLYIVAILISEIISTLAIFKLLRYTIVRYQTNERGGIHTGFASAGIVMIISGMCFHCSLKSIESLICLCLNPRDQQLIDFVILSLNFARLNRKLYNIANGNTE